MSPLKEADKELRLLMSRRNRVGMCREMRLGNGDGNI